MVHDFLKVTYLRLMRFRYRCAPLGVVIDISKAVDEYTKAWREKMEKFGAEHLREEAEEQGCGVVGDDHRRLEL